MIKAFISQFYFLLFVLMCSCTSQEKPIQTIEDRQLDNSTSCLHPQNRIADYVRHIIQDKYGDLWFGTNNLGVAHYNGDSLVYYSPLNGFGGAQITSITEDSDKNLWFSTNLGVVKYDGSLSENGDKLFKNYPATAVFNGQKPWSIYADSKGIIWVGTGKTVYRFEGEKWAPFELPYLSNEAPKLLTGVVTWSISEDRGGNYWFGTNGHGVIKYDGQTFTQYTAKDGLTDDSVDSAIEDLKGNMWFGTRHGGLSKFDGQNFINYTAYELGNNEVCAVYEDNLGNIWFSSEGYGVYRYNGLFFTNYAAEQGLGVAAVQTIYEDREGRFWVGGGGGLYRFDGQAFYHVSKSGPWE